MLYLEHKGEQIPIYDVVERVLDEMLTDTVILKLPSNFNFNDFKTNIEGILMVKHMVFKPKRRTDFKLPLAYYILICQRKEM